MGKTLKEFTVKGGALILEETSDLAGVKGLPVYTAWLYDGEKGVGYENYLDRMFADHAFGQRATSETPAMPTKINDGDAYETVALALEEYVYGDGTIEPPKDWDGLVRKIIKDTDYTSVEKCILIEPAILKKMIYAIATMSIMLRSRDAMKRLEAA